MFKNYIVTAFRNLVRHKLYSVINIGGLALGLTIFMLSNLFVSYEQNYDDFFEGADRIYAPYAVYVPGASSLNSTTSIQTAAAPFLRAMPGMEKVARLLDRGFVVRVGENQSYQGIRFADPDFLDIFNFTFLHGNAETALQNPNSVILTETTATRYFGEADPIGQTITLDGQHEMRVTAVIKDLPENSHFTTSFTELPSFEMLGSIAALTRLEDFDPTGNWHRISSGNMTYVRLAEGVTASSLEPALDQLIETHTSEVDRELLQTFRLRRLSDLNLYPWQASGLPVMAALQVVALLILGLSIINYTNLATAQAIGRAREVGLRKTLGAKRGDLVFQFLAEALVLTLLAALLAVVAVELTLPLVNNSIDRNIPFDLFGDVDTALSLAVLVLSTGIVAGGYPAFALSQINIVKVLSGTMRHGKGTARLRNTMLGVQFIFATVLITLVYVINAQNVHMKSGADVFDLSHTLNLRPFLHEMQPSYNTLKTELLAIPGVEAVSGSTQVPFQNFRVNRNLSNTTNAADNRHIFEMGMDEGFFDVYDMDLLAGRDLQSSDWRGDEEGAEIVQNIIINQTAARTFGWDQPEAAINQILYQISENVPAQPYTIVGVVEDRNFLDLHSIANPMYFRVRPDFFYTLSLKISENYTPDTLEAIDAAWGRVFPQWPVDRIFLRDRFDDNFRTYNALSLALTVLAILAIALAGLGLFGLTAFMAERRTHEIGIRKVMGARVGQIINLLIWQFTKPVVVAVVIATPLSYLAVQQYLTRFADRIELSPGFFIISGLLALLFSWAIVSGHAAKAARKNPIKALSHE